MTDAVLAGGAGLLAAVMAVGLSGGGVLAAGVVIVVLVVLGVAFRWPFWGLVLALCVSPFERFGLPLGGLQVTGADAVSMTAIAGWFVAVAPRWRDVRLPVSLVGPIALLLFSFVPSSLLAENGIAAYKQFSGWVNFAALFWMIAVVATPAQVRTLLGAVAGAGAIAGAMTALDPAFDLYGRASGPFGQPNTLGQFIVLALPLQVYFLFRARPSVQVASAIGVALSLYALTITLSRAAWAGAILVAFLLLAWRPARAPILVTLVAAVGLLALGANPAPSVIDTSTIVERVASSTDPSSAEASRLRADVYGTTPQIIIDNPLGIGAHNFDTVAPEYGLGYFPFNVAATSSAENIFLGIASEQGVIALVALLWLIVAVTLLVAGLRRSPSASSRELGLAIAGVLVAQLFTGFYHYGLHSNVIMLATFAVLGCAVALRRADLYARTASSAA